MNYLFTIKCNPIGRSLTNVLVTRCSDGKEYSVDFKTTSKSLFSVDVPYRSKRGVNFEEIVKELYDDLKEYGMHIFPFMIIENTLKRAALETYKGNERFCNSVLYVNEETGNLAADCVKDEHDK